MRTSGIVARSYPGIAEIRARIFLSSFCPVGLMNTQPAFLNHKRKGRSGSPCPGLDQCRSPCLARAIIPRHQGSLLACKIFIIDGGEKPEHFFYPRAPLKKIPLSRNHGRLLTYGRDQLGGRRGKKSATRTKPATGFAPRCTTRHSIDNHFLHLHDREGCTQARQLT
jgi:hypothetical protein